MIAMANQTYDLEQKHVGPLAKAIYISHNSATRNSSRSSKWKEAYFRELTYDSMFGWLRLSMLQELHAIHRQTVLLRCRPHYSDMG